MLSINTNSPALIAQNNLANTQKAMENSMLKLSTGLRINSAADDAAGLQISNRMETQMNGLDVAMRNANDAISMAQTAEGAMQENTNIMNRMRDLALQSANDSNTAEDRLAMQEEVNQLKTEVNRIADTTNFSGINLLDGSASNLTFQIGSNANETISFGISAMDTASLGAVATSDKVEVLRYEDANGETNEYGFNVTGADGTTQTLLKAGSAEELADKVTDFMADEYGVDVSVDVKADEKAGSHADAKVFDFTVAGDVEKGTAALTSALGNVIGDAGAGVTTTNLSNLDITTAAGAQRSTMILDNALAQVDSERANLGAVQNRLDSTISNLSNIQENMGVSQSRILDVDFAKETTNMTKSQMLMQAGSTVLSQAKQMPQYAVQLLG